MAHVTEVGGLKLSRLGPTCIRIEGTRTIYTDPTGITGSLPDADLILCTHYSDPELPDHDLQTLIDSSTCVLRPLAVPTPSPNGNNTFLTPGDTWNLDKLHVQAIPAYNPQKEESPTSTRLGYHLKLDGQSIYYGGATACIPEMFRIQCTIAFLPISGPGCMDPQEAAEATGRLRPRYAIPLHYGATGPTQEMAKEFANLIRCKAVLL
ncbi:MAG: MBL fold metallo-hydrolase [Planctomycetota bacterium]|nr:MBL fold metallo-hydrolase [Planctomycetota bacterium]